MENTCCSLQLSPCLHRELPAIIDAPSPWLPAGVLKARPVSGSQCWSKLPCCGHRSHTAPRLTCLSSGSTARKTFWCKWATCDEEHPKSPSCSFAKATYYADHHIDWWRNSPGHNFIVNFHNAVWITGPGADDNEERLTERGTVKTSDVSDSLLTLAILK